MGDSLIVTLNLHSTTLTVNSIIIYNWDILFITFNKVINHILYYTKYNYNDTFEIKYLTNNKTLCVRCWLNIFPGTYFIILNKNIYRDYTKAKQIFTCTKEMGV